MKPSHGKAPTAESCDSMLDRRRQKKRKSPDGARVLGHGRCFELHAAEEYVYPGGFLRSMRSIFPRSAPGVGEAIAINAAFFALVLSPLIADPRSTPIFSISIAGLLLANGALHVAGSCLSRRYSPGAITSVLCSFPAAIFTLLTLPREWHMAAGPIASGILLGIVWQLIPLALILLRR